MEKTTKIGGGDRKHGRSKRKGSDLIMSSFVRGKSDARTYFQAKGLTTHHAYIRNTQNIY